MKTFPLLSACICAVLISVALVPTAATQATDLQQIKIPPLPPFHPKEPKRIQLPNGMVIFLQEDHELPLIDGTARIRGGSREEPASKVGLVELYGEVWRTGGSKTQTGDQLDDFLEARAAKVETAGGVDSTSIGWSCLKGDFDDVFKVFLDLLREPAFRQEKLQLAQGEAFDSAESCKSYRNKMLREMNHAMERETEVTGYQIYLYRLKAWTYADCVSAQDQRIKEAR